MKPLFSSIASGLLVTALGACTDVPYDSELFPSKGVMTGTVTYMGPMPCSENGQILGNAVLVLLDVNALPPPAGLGLSAHRVVVIPGDVLFAGIADQIPVNPDGSRYCPDPAPTVQVAVSWDVGPVDPGLYNVRGWYDLDGDWHPGFKFSNMVTKGDIGGGAIANVSEALAGGPVDYTEVKVGILGQDGVYRIPELGFKARNVSVVLAKPVAIQRPYFHVGAMRSGGDADGTPEPIVAPSREDLVMPSDYHLYDAATFSVHDSLYWLEFFSGLPEPEALAAQQDPFFFHLGDPFFLQRYDADKDGTSTNRITSPAPPSPSLRSARS